MTQTSPIRTTFSTEDQEEAREFMKGAYGGSLKIGGESGDDWRASLDSQDFGAFRVSDIRLPPDLAFDVEGQGALLVNRVLAGTVEYEQDDGSAQQFGTGDVSIGNHTGAHFRCRTSALRMRSIDIPDSVVQEVIEQHAEDPGARVVYRSPEALDGGVERWDRILSWVDGLIADEAAAAPLVLGPAARLMAAGALSIFPTTVAIGAAHEGDGARPETLRRAIAFIEANPDRDLTIGEVGRAAYATPRAVQMAFRRHLDTTPMAYLRKVRLDQAHRELQGAVPGDGRTVARVALHWGFASPSRFAAYYRQAYGRSPSQTLAD